VLLYRYTTMHGEQNAHLIDIGKPRRAQQKLFIISYTILLFVILYNETSFDPTMGSSSGQEQKTVDMKCTWKCLTGSRSVYINLYIYLSIDLYQMINGLVCRKLHQVVLSWWVAAQCFHALYVEMLDLTFTACFRLLPRCTVSEAFVLLGYEAAYIGS
jgi:hypothetical protein